MNDEELAYIWFGYNQISMHKMQQVLEKLDSAEDIFDNAKVEKASFDEKIKAKMLKLDREEFLDEMLSLLEKYEITPITYVSKDYPEKLKNIPDPPLVLLVKGNIELLKKKSISIIGTRKPTTYGKIVCEKFTGELVSAGLVTVSGLAYGIDSCVAVKTLEEGGLTIAVLAGGLDRIYPSENYGLSKRVVENGGLLVSEQFPKVRPLGYMFIQRNRIVAGLGLGTLIIEAGKNSGTMTTARHAIEQGRELFVVPGNITSAESQGTNSLIDELPDTFTISTERILFKLGIKKVKEKERAEKNEQIDFLDGKILDALSEGELSFDELCEKTEIPSGTLSGTLIKLEMFGLIKSGSGNRYQKT